MKCICSKQEDLSPLHNESKKTKSNMLYSLLFGNSNAVLGGSGLAVLVKWLLNLTSPCCVTVAPFRLPLAKMTRTNLPIGTLTVRGNVAPAACIQNSTTVDLLMRVMTFVHMNIDFI